MKPQYVSWWTKCLSSVYFNKTKTTKVSSNDTVISVNQILGWKQPENQEKYFFDIC